MSVPSSPPATEPPVRVLIVDDDASLRNLIRAYLQEHGFEVTTAANAVEMRAVVERSIVDVVVLDVMMPGEDGLSLARSFSSRGNMAIIMVSALGGETDRIVGLEVGADDYLAKPVSPRELVARIRAVLRRRGSSEPELRGASYLFAGWRFDALRGILYDPDNVVASLSQGEYALLRAFLDHPQRVLTRDQLLEYSRSDANEAFDRAIDTQISRMRRKLSRRTESELIRTVRSEGYLFVPKVVKR